MSRPTRRALAALTILIAGSLAAAAPAQAADPVIPAMTNIRTGLNTGFDRIVLDLSSGPAPTVSYQLLDELTADPSGEIVWLTGEYFINVSATPAAAHDAAGQPTYSGPRKFRTRNLRNVMAVAVTGDFEAHLSVGLGVRARTAVNVFTLTAPNRVVIDVAS
ncbi:AMIN-like domain-containing (lipo)protein [Amycolatopsis lexingtonensis]|uniref:AMIN-like domain-containing (lipo)protein n=1 Tax=Amycolatopsis lexingtonensis TaxID=218822 RepID=UPI003F71B29F